MAVLGLDDKKPKKKSKSGKKSDDAQADEAQAMLEKMQAKKDADECPFC